MPQPTTLLDFAKGEKSEYESLEAEAAGALSTAREDLEQARSDLRSRSDDLTSARRRADALRERLAGVPTPGDGEELLEDLVESLMDIREALRAVHEARARIQDARVRMDAAADRRERARNRLRAAAEEVVEARSARETRNRWTRLLGQAPLDTLKADADALRNGSDVTRISDDLASAIPEKLRQAALKRRELELLRRSYARKLEAHARDLMDQESDDPAAGEKTAYRRARSALREYLEGAGDDLASARTFLEREVPEVGEGEEADLQDLAADGAPAADLEMALTDARIEVEKRRFELRKAELDVLADPSQDSAVNSARNELDDAESDRDDALSDFEADDHRRHLERWELALPDAVWRFFLRFHEVSGILDRLATLDPADLESDLDDAEEALAKARYDGAEEARRRRELSVRLGTLEARRRGVEEAFDARMFSAVRGAG